MIFDKKLKRFNYFLNAHNPQRKNHNSQIKTYNSRPTTHGPRLTIFKLSDV